MIKEPKKRFFLNCATIATCLVTSGVAHGDDGAANPTDAETDKQDDKAAPGSFVVDELAATRALERSLIRSDALLLAKGHMEIGFEYSYQFDEFISPLLLEFEADGDTPASTGLGERRITIANHGLSLDFKVGLPFDSQIELNLPAKYERIEYSTLFNGGELESAADNGNGVGDIQLSALKVLLREKGRRPDIIARLSVDTDSGESAKEGIFFGSGGVEVTVGLAATKRQDPLVFNYGVSHTIAETVDEVRAGPATQLYTGIYLAASPYTSLSLAFSQSVVGETKFNGTRIAGSDSASGTLSLGFSSTIGRNWFLSGIASAGLNESANDYVIAIGVSRRGVVR